MEYIVKAREKEAIRISRHGIAKRAGGRILGQEVFQFPDTPYYMACEMMRDQYPGAEIILISKEVQPDGA